MSHPKAPTRHPVYKELRSKRMQEHKLINWVVKERPRWRGISIAVALSILALILNYVFRIETERNLFFISLAMIIISASLAGFLPGLICSLLTSLGLNYFFLDPITSHHFESKEELVRIGIFFLTGLLMTFFGGTLRYSLIMLKKAQADAEEALHSRDEFISIVSHELKSPLTSLKLRTQLNLRALSHPEVAIDLVAQEKTLRSMIQTLGRAERLVEDLQDFSRITNNKLKIELEPVDLSELLRIVIGRFSDELNASNIKFRSEIEPEIIGAWDPLRIEQVITNLLSNAIKYGGGKPIEIGAKKTGELALIFVRDHGLGIPVADQQIVFARFERVTSSKTILGLGLGLYITKRIVELHHGRIWIEDTPGGGATFFVELPLTFAERLN
jgi:signal transduction histidine kinase